MTTYCMHQREKYRYFCRSSCQMKTTVVFISLEGVNIGPWFVPRVMITVENWRLQTHWRDFLWFATHKNNNIYLWQTYQMYLKFMYFKNIGLVKLRYQMRLDDNKRLLVTNKVKRDIYIYILLQWRHNECDGVSNHQLLECLFNCLFRHRSKKISQFRANGQCEGESTGDRWIPLTNGQWRGNVSI